MKCEWQPKRKWCPGLDATLNVEANRGRGLRIALITDMNKLMSAKTTGEATIARYVIGINFVNAEYKNGILINWCPWCGARMGQRDENGELVTANAADELEDK